MLSTSDRNKQLGATSLRHNCDRVGSAPRVRWGETDVRMGCDPGAVGPNRHTATVETPTVAIVLAAGAGTRFAGPDHKLTMPIGDRSIAEHAVGAALDAAIGPVVVVTGAIAVPLAALHRASCTSCTTPSGHRGRAPRCRPASPPHASSGRRRWWWVWPTNRSSLPRRGATSRHPTRRSQSRHTTARAAIRSASIRASGHRCPPTATSGLECSLV